MSDFFLVFDLFFLFSPQCHSLPHTKAPELQQHFLSLWALVLCSPNISSIEFRLIVLSFFFYFSCTQKSVVTLHFPFLQVDTFYFTFKSSPIIPQVYLNLFPSIPLCKLSTIPVSFPQLQRKCSIVPLAVSLSWTLIHLCFALY